MTRSSKRAGAKRGAPPRDWTNLWIALALILVTGGLYAPVRNYAFLYYDDPLYVTQNPHVQAGLTGDSIVWAWTEPLSATWHPLTTLSHMLDCQLFGLQPGPHHLGNVALHILNTLLLFGFLTRATAKRWRSAAVAALFAVHPLHVESVAWIAERKDVLSAFFGMLTLWAYLGYVRRPDAPRYALLLAAYAAALLSKPTVVTLPFVLLLLDFWPLGRWGGAGEQRSRMAGEQGPGGAEAQPRTPRSPVHLLTHRSLVIEKLPLLILAAIVSVITFVIQQRSGAVSSLDVSPIAGRVANALVAYEVYLAKMLWPVGLAVFYPFEARLPIWSVLGAGLLLVIASVAVGWGTRRHPYLLTGWLWYIGTLVPVIGLVRVGGHSVADRCTYVPLIGIFIIAAWGIPDLLGGWRHRQAACSAAAVLALGACTLLTSRQLQQWQDTMRLFQHALAVTSNNYVAHFMIGSVLFDEGRRDEAFTEFSETVRIEPTYYKADFDLGLMLAARGELEAAKQHYLAALHNYPFFIEAHNSLGVVLAAQGDIDGAIAHYREAIRLDPDFGAAHNNLAAALAGSGRTVEAIIQYTEAIRLSPQHAEPHWNLAVALQATGRLPEALEQFRTALQLNPRLVEARYRLATTYAQAGQVREAEAELTQVLRERPEWSAAEATLAWWLATADDAHLRDGPRAVQLAEDAAQRTQRRDANVLNSLAAAYAEVGRYPQAAAVATEALEAAHSGDRTALHDALTERLARYRAGQPVRERPGAQHP